MQKGKVRPLSGFPEWLPEQELIQQSLIRIVRRRFELHGFTPLQLRSMERVEDLISDSDTGKEIFAVQRLGGNPEGDDTPALALHYDLTMPFARYVMENQHKLTYPFRRYQVQSAWRGERPQLGRYREFIQADADVIGNGKLPVRHDADLIRLLMDALGDLPIPNVKLLLNNRKVLEGFYRGLGIEDIAATLRIVDKLPKIGEKGVRASLTQLGLSERQVEPCLAICRLELTVPAEIEKVRELGVAHELLDEGLAELSEVLARCQGGSPKVQAVAALHIARGFDYYTGTVVEGVLTEHPELGAVCSGGRYDNLASGSGASLPGVGISIGITRLMAYCFHLGLLQSKKKSPAEVVIAVHSEESRVASETVATSLRARGIACVVSESSAGYGKQIRAAEQLGVDYVWFPANETQGHSIRDIRTGSQSEGEPTVWRPPARDETAGG